MRYRFQHRDQVYEVVIERQGDSYLASVDGQPCDFDLLDSQPGLLSLRFEGRPISLYWAAENTTQWVSLDGCTYGLEKPKPRRQVSAAEDSLGEAVRAPMPAQVLGLQVAEGDLVEKGQALMLLEAMKMEIQIKAPLAGRVVRMLVSVGQSVEKDQLLVEIGEK
jgi:acetyl/propionyl-CoA carboxylase alpha subunit